MANAAGNNSRSDLLSVAGLTGIIAGVAGAAALIYGLGLLTLAASLRGQYVISLPAAWYSASLVHTTLVAVYGVKSLLWPAGIYATVFPLFVLKVWPWVSKNIWPEPGSAGWTWEKGILTFGVCVGSVLLFFTLFFLPAYDLYLANELTRSSAITNYVDFGQIRYAFRGWSLLWFFVFYALTSAGILLGTWLLITSRKLRNDSAQEAANSNAANAELLSVRASKYAVGGVLIIFLAAYIGAIFLAVPRQPPLPRVALLQQQGSSDSATPNLDSAPLSIIGLGDAWQHSKGLKELKNPTVIEGLLLARTDGYWYLIDENRKNLAIIPQTEGELALIPIKFSCEDFASRNKAQTFLEKNVRYAQELDKDDDGQACERRKFNEAPDADADTVDTIEDEPKVIAVLHGDTDPDGQELMLTKVVSTPNHGTADLLERRSPDEVRYDPADNFHGDDHFVYQVCDNGKPEERCATAEVTITIHGDDDSPMAMNDHYTIDEDHDLTIPSKGILGNDEDVDDDRITASVVEGPKSGALRLEEDGSFTYNPEANFNGDDFFEYEVSDTKGETDTATAKITVNPNPDQPTPDAGGPYFVNEGDSVVVSASGNDPDGGKLAYEWDLDSDGTFETPGRNATYSAWGLDGSVTYDIAVQVTDPEGASSVAESSVTVETLPSPPKHMCWS